MVIMDFAEYARKEFEKQYDSTFNIFEQKSAKIGSITKTQKVKIWDEDKLCRISQKQLTPTTTGPFAGEIYQTVLYCSPELEIKSGTEIVVKDTHGVVRNYKRSSEGFSSYRTHQEIILIRDEKA